MILKQKAFQKLAQIMKLKENQEKKSHIPVSNPNLTKARCAWSGTSSTPIPFGQIAVDIRSVITCTVQ